ncbi:MAG: 6-bladed beta-propeller, partial [Cytophagales bacterium]|nr:6-bladed beta-propeller [Cytophagales bacterium]
MKNERILFFAILLLALSLIACAFDENAKADKRTKSDTTNVESLRFPENGEDTLKVSYFADTVLYVPLETVAESFIKRANQIWMDDSIILINDNRRLLMFSRVGKFVRQVGRIGNGPGEYQGIFSFEVIDDTIYLSSTDKKSLI